jgi:hypothetical protein
VNRRRQWWRRRFPGRGQRESQEFDKKDESSCRVFDFNLCESLEIPFLNLYPEFLAFEEEERATLFDPADWHLSAFGNRVSGDLEASVLVKPRVPEPVWKTSWEGRPSVSRRPWL